MRIVSVTRLNYWRLWSCSVVPRQMCLEILPHLYSQGSLTPPELCKLRNSELCCCRYDIPIWVCTTHAMHNLKKVGEQFVSFFMTGALLYSSLSSNVSFTSYARSQRRVQYYVSHCQHKHPVLSFGRNKLRIFFISTFLQNSDRSFDILFLCHFCAQ